jgi:CRP/FNR family transcriptional regulator, cyclic AMP receptor protein
VTADELRAIPLFADASEAALETVASHAGEVTCEPGQILALEGDRGSGMFVVLDGDVSVEWRGGRVELGPGSFVGELTLLAPRGTRNARVRAATHVRCLAISRDDALHVVETEPSVALAMLREVARRFANALPDS